MTQTQYQNSLNNLADGVRFTPKGQHITDSQEKDQNCTHVSKIWAKKCLTYEQAKEKLSLDQQVIEDIKSPIKDWKPIVNTNGKFVLEYKDGRQFIPTKHAMQLMAMEGKTSSWILNSLTEPVIHATKLDKQTGDHVTVYNRDSRDAELIKHILEVHLWQKDRYNQDKTHLWRTWKDGTLRAFLSDKYAIINNGWVLQTVSKLIPGGLFSHWRGNADAIYGNILIPDSIRQESDSDYGGMISVGNSEIATRRLETLPSIFRSICLNGCIWEQKSGTAISKVHRGKIDYNNLQKQIEINLTKQIPLLGNGITLLLNSRDQKFNQDVTVHQMIAAISQSFKLNKHLAFGVLKNFNEEVKILGNDAKSIFGVIGAMTRFGQTQSNDTWLDMDITAGKLLSTNANKWLQFNNIAKSLDDNDLERIYGPKYGLAV